ncbi:MAG TPA: oligopeptide/dipeptide ABC transporter ATP-binding protein, partial [Sporosarcina sp.]|nr:oligopeptide/dipeptide ABC transporter ATP-binding protein [Sporosarcina sp.]
DSEQLYEKPLHPYTQALLSAVPVPDPDFQKEQIIIEGDIPNPADPPTGCTFHTRCPFKMDICTKVAPHLSEQTTGHSVACHLYASQVDNDIKQLEGSL